VTMFLRVLAVVVSHPSPSRYSGSGWGTRLRNKAAKKLRIKRSSAIYS
jgi:hypothetical protein